MDDLDIAHTKSILIYRTVLAGRILAFYRLRLPPIYLRCVLKREFALYEFSTTRDVVVGTWKNAPHAHGRILIAARRTHDRENVELKSKHQELQGQGTRDARRNSRRAVHLSGETRSLSPAPVYHRRLRPCTLHGGYTQRLRIIYLRISPQGRG